MAFRRYPASEQPSLFAGALRRRSFRWPLRPSNGLCVTGARVRSQPVLSEILHPVFL